MTVYLLYYEHFNREQKNFYALLWFVNKDMTAQILKLTFSFKSRRFFIWPKSPRQKFKHLKNEKGFKGCI